VALGQEKGNSSGKKVEARGRIRKEAYIVDG